WRVRAREVPRGVQWLFRRDREVAAFVVGQDFRVVYDALGRTHSFRHGARVSDRAEVDRAGDAKPAALLGLAARRSIRIGGPPLNSDWRPAAVGPGRPPRPPPTPPASPRPP